MQQSRSTWQKKEDWVGREVEVEWSDDDDKAVMGLVEEDEEEARREG